MEILHFVLRLFQFILLLSLILKKSKSINIPKIEKVAETFGSASLLETKKNTLSNRNTIAEVNDALKEVSDSLKSAQDTTRYYRNIVAWIVGIELLNYCIPIVIGWLNN